MTIRFFWIKIFMILAISSLVKEIIERKLFVLLRVICYLKLICSFRENIVKIKQKWFESSEYCHEKTKSWSNTFSASIRKFFHWNNVDLFMTYRGKWKWFLENVHNLDSKTSPSSQIFCFPSNFQNHRWCTEKRTFHWLSCPCFCKKWLNYKINSYYFAHKPMKSVLFKKSVGWAIRYKYHNYKYVFISLKIIIQSQKN